MESEKEIFLRKFEEKLKDRLDKKSLAQLSKGEFNDRLSSKDYELFRKEALPTGASLYEDYCNACEKILPLKPDKKNAEQLSAAIYNAHLNITPTGIMSASVMAALVIALIGVGIMLYSTTIGIGIIIIGLVFYFIMAQMPYLLAKRIRAKSSDQVIIAVFYIVAFMRFSSNFELAVQFAANYLAPPLSLDFKRLLWELENAKYSNIKIAFDKYLEGWRDENLEFLEAIYLIESSLYEGEDLRRISLLDKALDIILQGNYEKMMHFAQELRGKVTTFNMIGVVLPILGLIILPLAASFGDPKSTWQVVFVLYDIILPIVIGYAGIYIILNRPSSANSMKPSKEQEKQLKKIPIKISKTITISVSPIIPAILIFIGLTLIGLFPLIVNMIGANDAVNGILTSTFGATSPFGTFQEYINISPGDYLYGPYGTFPGIFSLFLPLALAFSIGYYLKQKYGQLIHMHDKTKKLEKEFPSATFQLGNRINEGISAELAFGAVAETMKGTEAGNFFSIIDSNIKFNGMSVEAAIFDDKKGAISQYPSDLVTSSMKIMARAMEKGPEITAKTLIDLSRYLSELHMSNERLKDLLSESLGSMKGQASFLAPIIAGVVISIVSLVTLIMGRLTQATDKIAAAGTAGAGAGISLGVGIPTYWFQVVVGIYMVLLIIVLVYMVVNLEFGEDKILMKYKIGETLIGSITKYAVISGGGILLFAFVGAQVLSSLG